jgi:putative resolvase
VIDTRFREGTLPVLAVLAVRVEAEVGARMNGARRKVRGLWLIRGQRWWWSIGIGWRGRTLSRWRRLVVLDCGEVTDDLVRDMVEVVTRLCAVVWVALGA